MNNLNKLMQEMEIINKYNLLYTTSVKNGFETLDIMYKLWNDSDINNFELQTMYFYLKTKCKNIDESQWFSKKDLDFISIFKFRKTMENEVENLIDNGEIKNFNSLSQLLDHVATEFNKSYFDQ